MAGSVVMTQETDTALSVAMSAEAAAPTVSLPLTLLVITYNEASNIAACLASVPFAQEKIVVDSGSQDETAAVAEAHGARVVAQPWLGYGQQRNFASTLATHEWILFIDADERLSPALAAEIANRFPELTRNPTAVGVLPRTTEFMGRPMRWYKPMRREWKARLYHRAHARWTEPRVHESLQFCGPSMRLQEALEHRHDLTLVQVQLKTLRYAELKALDRLSRKRKPIPWSWPLVFAVTFLKEYFVRFAVLDGTRGLIAAYSNANYTLYKRVREYEMRLIPESIPAVGAILGIRNSAERSR
jgi:glycosyltransferase involved in cell wall biosynthesis